MAPGIVTDAIYDPLSAFSPPAQAELLARCCSTPGSDSRNRPRLPFSMTKISTWWWRLWFGAVVVLAAGSPVVASAATPPPDPCKLITAAEIEAIAGPLKGASVQGSAGDVSCEYSPAKGPSWINVRLHEGELSYWKKRNGGDKPVALPEFGKDAFMNPDFDGSVELYAKKGNFVLRVSMPTDPAAVNMVKAIARKALARL